MVNDMTTGNSARKIFFFSLPLLIGTVFQQVYNLADSAIVGKILGTNPFAAVGLTGSITFFVLGLVFGSCSGFAIPVAQDFGAKNEEKLHRAVETTMMATFIMCVLFTAIGCLGVKPMLRFMSTPDDVFSDATVYLRIYFAGFSGLLIYNMGSAILRSVGDTTRPLYFLILTSVLNIILDLVFVLVFKMGIEGVAFATIISQFVSAGLILLLLTASRDVYRLTWNDLAIDGRIMKHIFTVGLPAGIQSVITAFSNVFVQSYINAFGSSCMAGWSCYNKLDQFVMLPMQSMAMASTTFVSQNMGAVQPERAEKGTYITTGLTLLITGVIVIALQVFASPSVRLFSQDPEVIRYGVLFIRANVCFLLFNCVNHVVAGALRGMGDSKGPMLIMLLTFVALRQTYLYFMTRYIANTPLTVGIGYPVGWVSCCLIEAAYFLLRRKKLLYRYRT